MEKKLTHDIAFFNLLRNLIPAKFKYNEYNFSINDIEEKLEMDKTIIRGLLKNLESDKLIKILNENDQDVKVSFETSYDNLLEVFTIEDIESLIKEMQNFIKRNYHYFNFEQHGLEDKFREYAIEAAKLIAEEGMSANLNPIISRGITEVLSVEKNNIILKKRIYDLCRDAASEELKALEAILFCDVNFPKTENPFYVTLFLTKLVIYMKNINNPNA